MSTSVPSRISPASVPACAAALLLFLLMASPGPVAAQTYHVPPSPPSPQSGAPAVATMLPSNPVEALPAWAAPMDPPASANRGGGNGRGRGPGNGNDRPCQNPNPPSWCGGGPEEVPVDGGLLLLVLAGGALALTRLRE